MYSGADPFGPPPGDPFGAPPPPTSPTAPRSAGEYWPGPPFGGPPPRGDYNTLAVLSPIVSVIVPPAGIALGHLALPQIKRTGERGRGAAIAGLVIGYLMCLVLIFVGVWWGTRASTAVDASATSHPTRAPSRSVITSVAPRTTPRRIKVDLANVPVGTCVEVQVRSTSDNEALDLFKVDCEHREGVYTVSARVGSSAQCRSVYVAAPPDHSFAICLNPY
ncbi:hypothetical protein A4G26_19935 [Mycobacterium kansasii]|uniref:DUF4190 domain-containing protein n=1 Tax=Mycobacterium innocens TaxID=2341083 RepID=A0A498QJP5_9MYCO|nr:MULTISPECIES: DUF4190 domain-containing protein [Mycobacterium]KZS51723.1 hypothetical protein A4G26_19935 [Mycobacterium kansasii]VBA45793.1 hypothetical protein LAUMK13_05530 [Mycobacterium innocens]